ncbi:MAG: hypothetical protein ACXVBE_04790 [Bdellovibrionota bacterium]
MRCFHKLFLCSLLLLFTALPCARADEPGGFKVLQPGTAVRGHIYLEDGPASVWSGNHSEYVANHFGLGLELQWGNDYQYFAAWVPVDSLSSAESAAPMGELTRESMNLEVGYFLVPDRWWLKYSFLFESVNGREVWGYKNTHGHGLSTGYRFFDRDKMNVTAVLGYQYIQNCPVTLVDNFTGAEIGSVYPQAHVLSLAIRFGLDLGGR